MRELALAGCALLSTGCQSQGAQSPAHTSLQAFCESEPPSFLLDRGGIAERHGPAASAWLLPQQECLSEEPASPAGYSPPQHSALEELLRSYLLELANDLREGRITYGEFARRRAALGPFSASRRAF